MLSITRRALTFGFAATVVTPALAHAATDPDDDPLELRTIRLEHEVLLALPRAPSLPVPLVILLHGLAETSDEHLGARAWVDRYGLATSVARLRRAPLTRVSPRDDWGPSLATTNATLATRPYRGLAFACPYVPRMASTGLAAYARWIVETLLPRVRAEAGDRLDASAPRLGGCSYGGWISLEVALRAPAAFSGWAGIQTAISREAASGYADRLARAPSSWPLLLETSTGNPFHDATIALADALQARKIPGDRIVLPGPHDQPWLRESGTPYALAWLDRS